MRQGLIGESDREQFAALYLNGRHQVTHAHVVAIGTATSAPVHPREVFKAAVLANASAVIVGHNHPSGDVSPSSEDQRLVRRLRTAGDVMGIRILDALIVGPTDRFYCEGSGVTVSRPGGLEPGTQAQAGVREGELALACDNLLLDIGEVVERAGEDWWGRTVTSGVHHRDFAKRLLGRAPYA